VRVGIQPIRIFPGSLWQNGYDLPPGRPSFITRVLGVVPRDPTLERRIMEFSGCHHGDGLGVSPGLCNAIGTLYPIAE
jgi:hypothetical protein